jgi:hypothetical protein
MVFFLDASQIAEFFPSTLRSTFLCATGGLL